MSNVNVSQIIPVNLILKPIELAVIAIWLIAVAQFFNFAFVSIDNINLAWFLTAPALMLSALVIAIRTHNTLPFIIIFSAGISAVFMFYDPELARLLLSDVNFAQNLNSHINQILITISLYSLSFWLMLSRFAASQIFLRLSKMITLKYDPYEQVTIVKKFCFNLSFFMINISVLISVLLGFDYFNGFNLIVYMAAIALLFLSEQFISEKIRGALLPVYITLSLVFYFSTQSGTAIIDSAAGQQILLIEAFALWGSHHFISLFYNRTFRSKKIMTGLWPWYGLLLILFVTLTQAPESLHSIASLLILMSYLFLMLRNTALALISWSLVFLLGWLFLVLLIPDNKMLFFFMSYGWELLSFSLSLLLMSAVWERHLNSIFMTIGWQAVSFKKPVLMISVMTSLFFLMLNTISAIGLITGWYDLMKEGIVTNNTSLLVLISFFSLSLVINNKVVTNLIHFSAIILLLLSWGANQVLPIYLVFALIQLVWILLPRIIKPFNQWLFAWDNIIKESDRWVYLSFAASIISLINALTLSNVDFSSADLLFTLGILLVSAVIYFKQQKKEGSKQVIELWYVLSYLLAAGLIVSLRLMFMGTVAVNELDTIGIFIISFSYYINQKLSLSSSGTNTHRFTKNLAKLLPLTALLTIPWTAGSLHSSLTLFVLGVFYFIIQGKSRVMQYCAFAFINIAAYIWMPLLSAHTGLLLFYVIPVVFSLLFVTYLHQNEMKKELQNKIRLIALSLIYVVVSADVFINETLFVFILGLLLGLASVIYGISSKTRVFLYTGVSFMIVIILSQLMLFYPEGRLARALILMLMGAMITGTMIWFNIKREMLLSKVRLFRADLDTWN